MPHLFIDTTHLNPTDAERFQVASNGLIGTVNLPEIPAVRAEIAALLDHVPPEPAERPPAAPFRARLSGWFPRWIGWLRAMPMP